MAETWKPIAGYEGLYEVSDLGRVRSLKFGKTKILKPGMVRGYFHVMLCKDGKVKHMSVHRLVAKAFVPNPQALPQVNHKDEDKLNNSVANLEWCTAGYNDNYGTRSMRIAEAHSKPVRMLDKQGNLLRTFPSAMDAERITGASHICECCRGELKSSGGFVWQYAREGAGEGRA